MKAFTHPLSSACAGFGDEKFKLLNALWPALGMSLGRFTTGVSKSSSSSWLSVAMDGFGTEGRARSLRVFCCGCPVCAFVGVESPIGKVLCGGGDR